MNFVTVIILNLKIMVKKGLINNKHNVMVYTEFII